MNLSIIIPTFNRLSILKLALSDLYKSIDNARNKSQSLIYHIIVIDDGSEDGTSEYLRNNHPRVHLLNGDGNLWWTGAVNMGAKYAIENLNPDYITLWNDDVMPHINYFEKLHERILQFSYSIIGSQIFEFDTKKKWSSSLKLNRFTGISSQNTAVINNKSNLFLYWLPGMGTTIPAKIISDLDFWDRDNFPQYFGDADFTLRASKRGFQIIFSDDMLIYNRTEFSYHPALDFKQFLSSISRKNIRSRYNYLIRYKFYKKHCYPFFWIATYLMYYIKYSLLFLKSSLTKN